MADKPKPPEGYKSWLDWAICNLKHEGTGVPPERFGDAVVACTTELAAKDALLRVMAIEHRDSTQRRHWSSIPTSKHYPHTEEWATRRDEFIAAMPELADVFKEKP